MGLPESYLRHGDTQITVKVPWLAERCVCVYVVTSRYFAVRSYSLRQKLLGHLNQTLFFSFSCSPRASQSCLSQFSHQILYTNIEGTGKHKSVPTILTETVVFTQSLLHVKKEKFWAKNLSFFTFNKNP